MLLHAVELQAKTRIYIGGQKDALVLPKTGCNFYLSLGVERKFSDVEVSFEQMKERHCEFILVRQDTFALFTVSNV
jgi:hypothetical protein